MDTTISEDNPFGWDRYGFLFEVLRSRVQKPRHLDYGTYDGNVLRELSRAGVIATGVGVDINSEVLFSQPELPSNVELALVETMPVVTIPYPDASFDTASLLDVIEHVYDQESVLKELARTLKEGGELIVTVPKKNVFSFLDTGNVKFRFPRLHRWFYEKLYSKDEYQKRYVECRDGLFGDIEIKKMWHQHFSEVELTSMLVESGFEIKLLDGAGFFLRMLAIASFLLPRSGKMLAGLISFDTRTFKSSNLFCVATKKG